MELDAKCGPEVMNAGFTPEQPAYDLKDRRVEVWRLANNVVSGYFARLKALLSPFERERATRFRFEEDQQAFVTTRACLRLLLARYTETSPLQVQFQYGIKGKPSLLSDPEFRFNVSHTEDVTVLAFTLGCELGVDVEHIHPMENLLDIAGHFFSAPEANELKTMPKAEQIRAFFLCWTRKEAYIKATGDGLSSSLSDFRVSLSPHEPARFLEFKNEPSSHQSWKLHNLDVGPNHAAAIAYCDDPRAVAVSSLLMPGQLLEDYRDF